MNIPKNTITLLGTLARSYGFNRRICNLINESNIENIT